MPRINFKQRDLEDRWVALQVACEDFVADVRKDAGKTFKVGIDYIVLYDVLKSTYHDISRYKNWHQRNPLEHKSDSIKRSAYFTKWLTRLRPIWAKRPADYQSGRHDRSVLLNERFAIDWSFANLSFELGRHCPMPRPAKLYDLLYDLHYRDLSDDALIHIFQLYYDLGRGEQVMIDLDRV